MNDDKPSYEQRMALIKERRANATLKERQERDARDLDEIEPLLADPNNGFLHIPAAAPELPGHVVFRSPSKPEIARYRAIIRRDASERGASEAKAKAGQELAANCILWPDAKRYEALVAAHPLVPDKVSVELFQMAEGQEREEAK